MTSLANSYSVTSFSRVLIITFHPRSMLITGPLWLFHAHYHLYHSPSGVDEFAHSM